MGDIMTFPETFDEFAELYKIIDKEEVYTNGIELIPIFRVKQWITRPTPLDDIIKTAKFEAITEFAERLKEKADTEIFEEYLPSGERYQLECKMVDIDDIDDLVKEMTNVIS